MSHEPPEAINVAHMYYSLNSLKGVIYGIIEGTTIEVIKGDTRSLDYSSHNYIQWLRGNPAPKFLNDTYLELL